MRHRAAVVAITALLAAACGGSGPGDANGDDALDGDVIALGDGVALDDTEIVATTTTRPASDSAGGAGEGDGDAGEGDGGGEADGDVTAGAGLDATTGDTLPRNEEESGDPANLFSAMRVFNECLADEGQSFIGVPDDSLEPDDPVNDPEYLDALQKCAGLSNIQQAFADFQEANTNLTQVEIEERNRGLVVWADCLRGRGWSIDDLEPDDRGLLTPVGLEPPDGESLLGGDDMQECAATAQAEIESDDEDGGATES